MVEKNLELRHTPVWERPQLLASAFSALGTGQSFTFITDADPLPLLTVLEGTFARSALWRQRNVGYREWEVTVTRTEPASSAGVATILQRSALAACEPETLAKLAAVAREHTAVKGTYLYRENESWPFLGVMAEGALSAGAGATASRERTFFEVHPFMLFGIAAALDAGRTFTNMRVISKNASYVTLPIDVVRKAASTDPQVHAAIGFASAQQSRSLARVLTAQVSLPTIGRVAAALLPYASPERGLLPAMPPLAMMTQTQLAAAAGTVKEVAARAIAELESNAALRRERGRVRYLDRAKLLEYTQ